MKRYTKEDCSRTGWGFPIEHEVVLLSEQAQQVSGHGQLGFCLGGDAAREKGEHGGVFLASLEDGECFSCDRREVEGILKRELLTEEARLQISQIHPAGTPDSPREYTGYSFLKDGRYAAGVGLSGPAAVMAYIDMQGPYQHRILVCDRMDFTVLEMVEGRLVFVGTELYESPDEEEEREWEPAGEDEEMKQIYIENGIILYYGSRAGQVVKGSAAVDSLFYGPELDEFLKKRPDIQNVRWVTGMYDRLMNGLKESVLLQPLKDVRVWQLKPDVDVRMKFISFDEMIHDFGAPDISDYEMVYEGTVETNDLESLFLMFRDQPPDGFTGHPMAVSDVIELYDQNDRHFYYADIMGFQKVDILQPDETNIFLSMQP